MGKPTYITTTSATMIRSYDDLERITSKTFPNTIPGKIEDVTYVYDTCDLGIGRLCERTDESGVTTFSYDGFGNITGESRTTNGITFIQTYIYDDGDNVIAQTLPSGRNVTIARDKVRRIEAISTDINGSSQSTISDITYRGDNQITSAIFGNGAVDTRTYDLQGRLKAQQLSGSSLIDERSYDYDKNSNITSILGNAEDNTYGYDPLDRIAVDTINAGIPIEFGYDLNDNRLTKSNEQLTIDASSNRLLKREVIITDGSSAGFREREMVYNDAGRLFRLIEEGELKASYVYNDNGQRTSKTIHNPDTSTTTTLYHYDQFRQLVSETTETGAPIRDYLWHDNGEAKAQIDTNGGNDSIAYLHSDHLFTIRVATDRGQRVIWRWEGEAFGNTSADKITGVTINLRFPGQYFDAETNLHYNYFRYYDSEIGSYITSDPIGILVMGTKKEFEIIWEINPYQYSVSNPLNRSDPLGLFSIAIGGSGSFFYGGVGGNVTGTFGVDSSGKVCASITICGRVGFGASTSVRGVVSLGQGLFCEGDTGSGGFFAGGGFGRFRSISTRTDSNANLTVTLGRGAGGGVSGGTQFCNTKTSCF